MKLKYKVTLAFAVNIVFLMTLVLFGAQKLVRQTIENDLQGQIDVAASEVFWTFYREQERWGVIQQKDVSALLSQSLVSTLPIVRVRVGYEGRYGEWTETRAYMPQYLSPQPDGSLNLDGPALVSTLQTSVMETLPYGASLQIVIEASSAEADMLAMGLQRLFTGFTLGGLMFLIVVIFLMTHNLVTVPLNALARITRQVGRGNLNVKPDPGLLERKDEVGALSNSIQIMVDALRLARDENQALLERTQNFNRELEERVQEAKTDLAGKNEALVVARECISRQERLAALGQLAGNIAHEIGTPLSTLSGYLQLALADKELSPNMKELLDVAAGEASRVTRIIRRILDSTRGLKPVLETFDLTEQVEQVVEMTLPQARSERYQVLIDIQPEVKRVHSDPGMLRQVLLNLVRNAFDAMPEGGELRIRGRAENGTLVLQVEDSGSGVPLAAHERIFEPFYTTKEVGHGTGLGLSISRELARALKGTLLLHPAQTGGAPTQHGNGQTAGEGGESGASPVGACFELRLPLSAPRPVFGVQAPEPYVMS